MPYGAIIGAAAGSVDTEGVKSSGTNTAMGLAQIADGWYRKHEAKKALKKLAKWNPKFRDASSISNEAEATVTYGYTPEEKAAFLGNLSRANNAQYRLAVNRNPNLSGAINAGINYANIGALNEFASNDSRIRQDKVQRQMSLITGQSNNQTVADIASKREQEIAYGTAVNQARAQMWAGADQMAAGLTMSSKGGGGTGAQQSNAMNAPIKTSAPPTYTPPLQEQSAPPINIGSYQSPYGAYDPYNRTSAPAPTLVQPLAVQTGPRAEKALMGEDYFVNPSYVNPYSPNKTNPYLTY